MELQKFEKNNERVLLTSQLAESYETTSKIISYNFNNNKDRYIEGKHYYCLIGDELREFKANLEFQELPNTINKLYLWTQKGALLHAKSLNTDKAWEVYDYLVDYYFKDKENTSHLTGQALIATALIEANRLLETISNENAKFITTVAVQEQQINEFKPKASYYDVVLNCKDLVTISIIAKDYGKSAKWFNSYLHDKEVQFKQGGIWLLYQKYAEQGYTSTKIQIYNGNDNRMHTKIHTYWTQKGRLFIYNFLKSDGILPLMEKKIW